MSGPADQTNEADPRADSVRWDAATGLLHREPRPTAAPTAAEPPWRRGKSDLVHVALPPLSIPGAATAGRAQVPEPRQAGNRALLLEPDDELQRLVAKLLIHDGFDVRRAYTWEEALDVLAHERIDLMLSRNASLNDDVHRETIRRLRQGVSVRVVDNYGAILAGQHERYERMARGLIGALDALVTLLEQASGDFRAHSQLVARYCRHVGRRLGIPRRDLDAMTVAAYLRDLPRMAETGPAPDAAASTARLLRLLAVMDLPYDVEGLLVPADPSRPEDLPPAVRVLNVVEAYEHFRCAGAEERTPAEAIAMVRAGEGRAFDPRVVEIFANVLRSDIVLQRLDRASQRILLASPDDAERETLTLRCQNEGYTVAAAASVQEAVVEAQASPPSAVVARHGFPDGDGFDLLRRLREESGVTAAPVFLLLPSIDHDGMRRLLQEGAEDAIPGALNIEVVAFKLNRCLERLRGVRADDDGDDCVRGRIEDLGLIEAVQILCAGGRSGTLHLQSGDIEGSIVLRDGRVVHASCGDLEPTEAFVSMVSWRQGRFRIERNVIPVEPSIRTSTEWLIMEACRRLDEAASAGPALR